MKNNSKSKIPTQFKRGAHPWITNHSSQLALGQPMNKRQYRRGLAKLAKKLNLSEAQMTNVVLPKIQK